MKTVANHTTKIALFAIATLALMAPENAAANEPQLWQSQNGQSFTVMRATKLQGGGWSLFIQEGQATGTIILKKGKAVKEVMIDLSRFRVEGDVPRTRKVDGTYANDQFTFGRETYKRVANPAPQ